MEQLQLLVRPPRIHLPQAVRDELLGRMVEAIVLVFKTESEESHDWVTPEDQS